MNEPQIKAFEYLQGIFESGSGIPIFSWNPKFKPNGNKTTPFISYADVMDYRCIVRATDDVEKRRSCEEDVIAEYNSLESLVLDGWGFEQPSASAKMEWFSMQAEGETNSDEFLRAELETERETEENISLSEDQWFQKRELQLIALHGRFSPVFRRNRKYELGEDCVAFIARDDLIAGRICVRKTDDLDSLGDGGADRDLVAMYESLDELVRDGWRLD
jgi:hypothetical protein